MSHRMYYIDAYTTMKSTVVPSTGDVTINIHCTLLFPIAESEVYNNCIYSNAAVYSTVIIVSPSMVTVDSTGDA